MKRNFRIICGRPGGLRETSRGNSNRIVTYKAVGTSLSSFLLLGKNPNSKSSVPRLVDRIVDHDLAADA
ncbi:MAG TPA: hypothetical protein VN976_23085 [Verrucomicrobiae bacterium]|nr:hypothetical protein [Verrucomicrobiae bacterium]